MKISTFLSVFAAALVGALVGATAAGYPINADPTAPSKVSVDQELASPVAVSVSEPDQQKSTRMSVDLNHQSIPESGWFTYAALLGTHYIVPSSSVVSKKILSLLLLATPVASSIPATSSYHDDDDQLIGEAPASAPTEPDDTAIKWEFPSFAPLPTPPQKPLRKIPHRPRRHRSDEPVTVTSFIVYVGTELAWYAQNTICGFWGLTSEHTRLCPQWRDHSEWADRFLTGYAEDPEDLPCFQFQEDWPEANDVLPLPAPPPTCDSVIRLFDRPEGELPCIPAFVTVVDYPAEGNLMFPTFPGGCETLELDLVPCKEHTPPVVWLDAKSTFPIFPGGCHVSEGPTFFQELFLLAYDKTMEASDLAWKWFQGVLDS